MAQHGEVVPRPLVLQFWFGLFLYRVAFICLMFRNKGTLTDLESPLYTGLKVFLQSKVLCALF